MDITRVVAELVDLHREGELSCASRIKVIEALEYALSDFKRSLDWLHCLRESHYEYCMFFNQQTLSLQEQQIIETAGMCGLSVLTDKQVLRTIVDPSFFLCICDIIIDQLGKSQYWQDKAKQYAIKA